MDLGLQDATAVVTGGSKGMGRAIAERLAAEGAQVAILARGRVAIDETVTALHNAGSAGSLGLSVDVTDGRQVEGAFADLGRRWGSLNCRCRSGTVADSADRRWLENNCTSHI